MKLNTLNIKIKTLKKRLGRGIGSGKGKTSGRGHKGQKSRSGVAIKSFEGGQMPLYRRLPKRGFRQLNKKRVGRGSGSGKGSTCGRGIKGQKSRSGVAIKSFEGGQMPLYRRLPKRGFNSINKNKIAKINLEKLQKLIDKKRIKSDEKINLEILKKEKIIKGSYLRFKILGTGDINTRLDIEVDFSSKTAKEKIEKAGGIIKILKSK